MPGIVTKDLAKNNFPYLREVIIDAILSGYHATCDAII